MRGGIEMYRREYPDVPGLFDARFSEYNQPSLAREFQKTWLVSLIGLIMVATGSGILFWNEVDISPSPVLVYIYCGSFRVERSELQQLWKVRILVFG